MKRRKLIFKHLKTSTGSSLVEVSFFLGIIGIVGLAVTMQMSQQSQDMVSIEKQQAFLELVNELENFSSSHTLCTAVLGGSPPPSAAAPLSIVTGGLNIVPGGSFLNGVLKITQLKWQKVLSLSATESIGYFSVEADLSNGNPQTIVGGNVRDFPAGGSNPPGIMVDMQVDSTTGNVVSCGAPAASGTTEYFTFPVTVSIHDSTDYHGTEMLPTPFPDNNYVVICSMTNPQADAHGINYGQITQTALYPGSFDWHYWQERGNYIPSGTILTANCIAHHGATSAPSSPSAPSSTWACNCTGGTAPGFCVTAPLSGACYLVGTWLCTLCPTSACTVTGMGPDSAQCTPAP